MIEFLAAEFFDNAPWDRRTRASDRQSGSENCPQLCRSDNVWPYISTRSYSNRGSMHPNAELIKTFYEAFQKLDAETMARCYAADVVFSDPLFPLGLR